MRPRSHWNIHWVQIVYLVTLRLLKTNFTRPPRRMPGAHAFRDIRMRAPGDTSPPSLPDVFSACIEEIDPDSEANCGGGGFLVSRNSIFYIIFSVI